VAVATETIVPVVTAAANKFLTEGFYETKNIFPTVINAVNHHIQLRSSGTVISHC